jgi:hypothetical protein
MYWVYEGGVPIWERANVQRVVSMAACIVDGSLIVGNRHFCPIMQMTLDQLGIKARGKHDMEQGQGFVDQWGVYMTRQEAWDVAKAAGQIKEVFTEGVLYSECYL